MAEQQEAVTESQQMPSERPPAAVKEARALVELRGLVQSGRPVLYVHSAEERRVDALLDAVANTAFKTPVPVWSWSLTEGLQRRGGGGPETPVTGARAVLDWIAEHDQPGVFQLKDFHDFMRESAEVRRRLRDLYDCCLDTGKYVIITSPITYVPEELNRTIALIELGTPDLAELLDFLREDLDALAKGGASIDSGEATVYEFARALQGLTLDEARYSLRRALSETGKLDDSVLSHLLEEKRLLVKKTGLIEFIPTTTKLEQIGGLEYLKKWLLERRKLFFLQESVAAEIVPKGLLVMGVSGCGKSLSVKAIASYFRLPLYRIDMIEVFSGRHGNADGAFAEACRTVEALSPAVVWFDEIEMGISARTGEASNLGRIFAFFLTWMQEKSRGLFVAATANRIDLLPAEMIRKGRFDEVFFIDVPIDDERVEIFKIHLARRGLDPEKFDLERLKRFTRGWSGAEVEQCVISALTASKLEDREPTTADLIAVAGTVVPLSKTMKEQVDHIRAWAYDRAVRASPRETQR